MEFLKTWITSIVTVVIFLTIVEMVLPNGSIKKYVKLATGLIVMIVILSPLFKVLDKDFKLDEKLMGYSEQIAGNYKSVDVNLAKENMKKQTEEVFTANLKESIQKEIKGKTGEDYIVSSISIKKTQNNEFGEVENIEIKKVSGENEIVPVESIKIGEEPKEEEAPRDKNVLNVLENQFNIKDTVVKFIK